jgi:hypothetical protein
MNIFDKLHFQTFSGLGSCRRRFFVPQKNISIFLKTFVGSMSSDVIKQMLATYLLIWITGYIRTYMHACIHAHIHTYVRTYVHTYIHTCTHTYTHVCLHKYTHAYIHAYIWLSADARRVRPRQPCIFTFMSLGLRYCGHRMSCWVCRQGSQSSIARICTIRRCCAVLTAPSLPTRLHW